MFLFNLPTQSCEMGPAPSQEAWGLLVLSHRPADCSLPSRPGQAVLEDGMRVELGFPSALPTSCTELRAFECPAPLQTPVCRPAPGGQGGAEGSSWIMLRREDDTQTRGQTDIKLVLQPGAESVKRALPVTRPAQQVGSWTGPAPQAVGSPRREDSLAIHLLPALPGGAFREHRRMRGWLVTTPSWRRSVPPSRSFCLPWCL